MLFSQVFDKERNGKLLYAFRERLKVDVVMQVGLDPTRTGWTGKWIKLFGEMYHLQFICRCPVETLDSNIAKDSFIDEEIFSNSKVILP